MGLSGFCPENPWAGQRGFESLVDQRGLQATERFLGEVEAQLAGRGLDIGLFDRLDFHFTQSAGEQMMLADQLMSKARKVSSAAKNNRDINAKTIELAELYEGHLMNRSAELKRLHREMQINFELAVNTFRTIKVGGELIDVMKTSERDLKSIFEFDAPQFSAFYDKTLRAEFAAMTQKIRAQ